METYLVQIVNPKAVRLLEDLADMELIALQPRPPLAEKKPLTEAERQEARERVMRGGSQTLDVEAMIAYNKQDRPMPFQDNE